ncbi:PEP-CTERM sorting domain-containing protein [Calothrix sp. FACHB-156]|nr:PEP-CTERM sorting domain-containing protein [Nostoc linckia FACHB-104]MBD2340856.1 PEP-CTERM sorting domain-containing protein [Calothrix sp. FACHB-156]
MKLNKHVSIAAASVALTVAAVSAKPAQAASVVFDKQVGQEYKYKIKLDNANAADNNEQLKAGSSWTLSGMKGVDKVFADLDYLISLITPDKESVQLILKKQVTDKVGTSPSYLDFSIFSPFAPGTVDWSLTRLNPTKPTQTLFDDEVIGPVEDVPEPMTIGGSLLAVGFGTWLKRKKAESTQKA